MALKVLEKYGGLEPVYHEFYKVCEERNEPEG
jgi:hypothetical protein